LYWVLCPQKMQNSTLATQIGFWTHACAYAT
jgi:hypothetical protein